MKTLMVTMIIMQVIILIAGVITVHKLLGITELIRWELSNMEQLIKTRINAFLGVFKRNRNLDHLKNKEGNENGI